MKDGRSLEQQRKALLEQIHASRAVYRRMLTGDTGEHEAYENSNNMQPVGTAQSSELPADPYFPRSMTMKWVMKHPYYAAAAVAGVALVIPKTVGLAGRAAGSAFTKKKKTEHAYTNANTAAFNPQMPQQPVAYAPYAGNGYPQPIYIQQPSAPAKKTGILAGVAAFGGTALTSIITIATMVLRDPAKMQMAMRLFSTASQHLKNRRAQTTAQPFAQPPQPR